ncbi:MAG: uroporphyrinogen decarboxylase [Pseudomonadota bacterium]
MDYKIIKAINGEKLDSPPIWIMRQAGRYLPEYREIRKKYNFTEMYKNPEIACEVTLQPIRRFGFDASILFSDILVIPEAMGMDLEFIEGKGPVFKNPLLNTQDGLKLLREINPNEELEYVMQAIELIRENLPAETALIGFSGAPFTLATYMLEGGSSKNFAKIKEFMYSYPQAFHGLMDKLTVAVIAYLNAQIDSGINLFQVFDTWAGILTSQDYKEYVLPYTKKIFKSVNKVPGIHYANHSYALLETFTEINPDVYGVDWHLDLSLALEKLAVRTAYSVQRTANEKLQDGLSQDVVIQGNLDPTVLFASEEIIKDRVLKIIEQGKMAKGHIFNLGHGILPNTDPDKVKYLIDIIRDN